MTKIYRLEITSGTKQDIEESYLWYESKLAGLGNEFIIAIDHQFQRILSHPNSFPIFIDDYRRCLTRRFPFKIIFSVNNETITVWAVFHHKRDLKKWKR